MKYNRTYNFSAGPAMMPEPVLEEIPCPAGRLDPAAVAQRLDGTVAAVVVATPNYFGLLEDGAALAEAVHAAGALLIAAADPTSRSTRASPGCGGTPPGASCPATGSTTRRSCSPTGR